MSAWKTGAGEIQGLIDDGKLTRLTGTRASVEGLMDRARQLLNSASGLLKTDPATAYIVAYDAAKHAAMALLAAQDLRSTPQGGHVAMERALFAQFPNVFTGMRQLRRRRHDLDYPTSPDDSADEAEATIALASATSIVADAQTILDQGVLEVF